jgi:hypothetical protein
VGGRIAINAVRVGDTVHAWDAAEAAMTMARITHIHTAVSNKLVDIVLDGDEVITCTPMHQFYTTEWTSARSLREGDLLVTRDGTVEVRSVRHRAARRKVFNLVVAGMNTYFVGINGALVRSVKPVSPINGGQRRRVAAGAGSARA